MNTDVGFIKVSKVLEASCKSVRYCQLEKVAQKDWMWKTENRLR